MPVQRAKLAFKGRDRKRIKELLNFLTQIQRMDTRNEAMATKKGVPAVKFAVATGVNITGAITSVKDRCTAALTQTNAAVQNPGNGQG